MKHLRVSLLGRFHITWTGRPVDGFDHTKMRELFCYLLIHRNEANAREVIATQLWGEHYTTEVSKRYLRKALWQLRESLASCSNNQLDDLLTAEAEWLQVNLVDSLWLDLAIVDEVYSLVKGTPGTRLDPDTARRASDTIDLFTGDLLEGEQGEWFFLESVRYRHLNLLLIDKLIDYSIAHKEYESALALGERALRLDPALEFVHLKMMRAYYLSGNRTKAIRQFLRYRDVLRDDLMMEPSKQALKQFEEIRQAEGDVQTAPYLVHSARTAGANTTPALTGPPDAGNSGGAMGAAVGHNC